MSDNLSRESVWLRAVKGFDAKCYDILLGAAFVVALITVFYHPYRINHDCSFILQFSQLLLEGKRPYIDFSDTNPPLIFYFFAIPAFVAKLFSLNVILVFSLFILTLVFGSALLLRNLLKRIVEPARHADVEIFVLFWLLCAYYVWSKVDFGQRDHLVMLLYFPLFAARWLRWEGVSFPRPLAILVGVLGAVGVCLKPYFLLLALAPELYWLVTKRNLRSCLAPEATAFVLTGAAYALHFLFLPAEIRSELFDHLFPMITKGYFVYKSPTAVLLSFSLLFFFLYVKLVVFTPTMAAMPFLLSPTNRSRLWELGKPLALLTLMGFASFWWQHTGWSYHAIPAIYGSLMLLALLLSQVRLFGFGVSGGSEGVYRVRMWRSLFFLLLAASLGYYGFRVVDGGVASKPNDSLTRMVERFSEEGESVLFLSTSIIPAYPLLLQTNRIHGSRYPCQFPLAFLLGINAEDPDFARREEARYRQGLAEDIAKNRPQIVFIDNDFNNQGIAPGFDIHTYLNKAGFIESALADYKRYPNLSYPGFAVYLRDSAVSR